GDVRNYVPLPVNEIRPNDYTNIIEFQSLASVNTSHLIDRARRHDPQATILIEIPPPAISELGKFDVPCRRILFARPLPAVARDNTRPVVGPVSEIDQGVQYRGAVEYTKVV